MTARFVLVATQTPDRVGDAMRWARTPVRVVPAAQGWVWVLPSDDQPVAMNRVVDEASDVGPALLVTVTPWRSELQLWRDEKPVRTLAWEAGTVCGLDPDEAEACAAELLGLLTPTPATASRPRTAEEEALVRRLSLQLAGPRPGTSAWRDVVDLLRLPVPAGFPDLPADELAPGRGAVVHATGFLDAARTPTAGGRRAAAAPAPAPAPRSLAVVRAVALAAVAVGCWLTASTRSWMPLAVTAAVLAGCVGVTLAAGPRRRGTREGPDQR